jgi:hypothetical protein
MKIPSLTTAISVAFQVECLEDSQTQEGKQQMVVKLQGPTVCKVISSDKIARLNTTRKVKILIKRMFVI